MRYLTPVLLILAFLSFGTLLLFNGYKVAGGFVLALILFVSWPSKETEEE